MLRAQDKYLDNIALLPAVFRSYIPKQMLKNVKLEGCFVRNELEYVQKLLDNSNDNLRMCGSAESLWQNLKVYMEFPLRRKMFPLEMGNYHSTIPDIYQTLKKEVLYCKQDLLFYLQSCVYKELRLYGNAQKSKFAELIEYMKNHEERLSGCYEFVKYDHDVFEDIRKPFLNAGSLCVCPENALVTAVERVETQLTFYKETDFVEVFGNLISKYPCLFLPNSETKDTNATAVVRIFDHGGMKFVMESELFAAINLKNPDQKPLECMDIEGHYRTIDYKNVLELYRDKISEIDFIYHPIPYGLNDGVPIAAPTGDHCFQAVGAQMGIITQTILVGIFQKITQNTSHMIPKFIAILRKYFPSNIRYRYFINVKLLQKLREELEEFWKPIEDKPMKRVRDVGPQGFTVEDLKRELKYLGYTKIFPEVTADAREAYTAIFFSLKPSDLKTSDMFAAIQASLTIVLAGRYPCLNEFMYRQKVCMHNCTKPCGHCVKAFKEAEAKIEAEMKAESEQASSSVTGTTSGNDSEKEKASEESKHELVTSEALPIVQRDPENLRDSVESSFAEAETKEIPAVLELEISEQHNPVLPESNDQKMPRESCSKATKESEFEQAPSSITTKTSGGDAEKEEASEESKHESVTNEASEKTINNPVEAKINSLPAISEAAVPEHNPVLPDSNTHICKKCMETFNEARGEVIETYRKIMILEKKLKEKDAELERLKVYEEKSKKSDETEKKSKDLEKEADEWKMKHFKILEENVKMGNMLKSTGNLKALESQINEKDEQLRNVQKALEEKEERCQELEKTVKEREEKVCELSKVNMSVNQEKENIKATLNESQARLVKKDKEIDKLKKENHKSYKKIKSSILDLEKRVNAGLEKQKANDLKIQMLELDNSILTEEKNQEVEKFKKQQAMAAKEHKKEMEQLKRNASTSADEIKKLTARIAEKEAAENLLKRSNKGLLEKLQKSESSLKEVSNRRVHLETEVAQKNRKFCLFLLELQKSAENQVSEQERTKKELETRISKIRGMLDEISPPEPEPEDSDCLICLEEIKPEQKTLKCDHCGKIMHLKCTSNWHKVKRICAHCQQNQLDPNEFPSLQ